MTKAWMIAYRMPATLSVSLVLALLSRSASDALLNLLNLQPIRTAWFILLAAAMVAVLPLTPSFGMLEDTFVRTPRDRGLRVSVVLLLLAGQASLVDLADAPPAVLKWFGVLSAVSIASVILLGRLAWFVTLTVGALSIVVEHTWHGLPVSRVSDSLPAPLAALLCLVGAALYVARGPRAD